MRSDLLISLLVLWPAAGQQSAIKPIIGLNAMLDGEVLDNSLARGLPRGGRRAAAGAKPGCPWLRT